ncbi:MAG: hypothetical protein H6625_00155 [Bdellovibrionaceae bacterium]|nr:hypothetical protein [Pseudobdellovibrionaceae bacterium]
MGVFLITILIALLGSHIAWGSETQTKEIFLGRYYDCAERTYPLLEDLPISIKIDGGSLKNLYSAKEYSEGIPISIVVNEKNEIVKVKLGEKIDLPLDKFRKGIEFGLLGVTAHTVQLVKGNNQDEEHLEFGFLKNFFSGPKSVSHDKENLNAFYKKKYGKNWEEFSLKLVKNKNSNNWELINMDGTKMSAIYGILKINWKFFVSGIQKMAAFELDERISTCKSQDGNDEGSERKIITLKTDSGKFNCELSRKKYGNTFDDFQILAP